jgi:hypothetical protein
MIGEVGSKHMVYIPEVMPSLLDLLNDDTPAVARQAVKTGTNLFAKVLQQLVIQVILLAVSSGVACVYVDFGSCCYLLVLNPGLVLKRRD